jgi:uncharacterized protein (DUF2267 family)
MVGVATVAADAEAHLTGDDAGRTDAAHGAPMQFDEFIDQVQQRGGFEQRDPAWEATARSLELLAMTLGEEARNAAAQLPDELGDVLGGAPNDNRRTLTTDEFLIELRQRVPYEASEDEIRTHASATLSTLRDAITGPEWADLLRELPDGYGELI